jgi:hypothetical protein
MTDRFHLWIVRRCTTLTAAILADDFFAILQSSMGNQTLFTCDSTEQSSKIHDYLRSWEAGPIEESVWFALLCTQYARKYALRLCAKLQKSIVCTRHLKQEPPDEDSEFQLFLGRFPSLFLTSRSFQYFLRLKFP